MSTPNVIRSAPTRKRTTKPTIAAAEGYRRANVGAAEIIIEDPRYSGSLLEEWAQMVLECNRERVESSLLHAVNWRGEVLLPSETGVPRTIASRVHPNVAL